MSNLRDSRKYHKLLQLEPSDCTPAPPPASPTTLLATSRDWPRCTTYDCLDHGARMATGLSADGAPIFSCPECYASVPRTPRPDTPPALKHHLRNAELPDEMFDSLLRAHDAMDQDGSPIRECQTCGERYSEVQVKYYDGICEDCYEADQIEESQRLEEQWQNAVRRGIG